MDRHPLNVHWLDSTDSPEFPRLRWALTRSTVIGLDAEWKAIRVHHSVFPTVSLLQIACRLSPETHPTRHNSSEPLVFLLDLASIHLPSIYELLKDVFVSPSVIKLGFKFKQDLIYLSSTFSAAGCDPGFDRVEPYLDIASIYHHLHHKHPGRKLPKQTKSLASICKEVLGISLSKELQCSDWSMRPLTEEQKAYAAKDAYCLLEIFSVFLAKAEIEETSSIGAGNIWSYKLDPGLKQILEMSSHREKVVAIKFGEASDILRATLSEPCKEVCSVDVEDFLESCSITEVLDDRLLKISRTYGDKILLKETDRKPKMSKKKVKKTSADTYISKVKLLEDIDYWQGPPPWDLSFGGDGCPRFLCDVMVEGLAKQLRCVGIDAAIPRSRKPETRELIDQVCKEKRVLLTRDAKLLRHEYLLKNQIYRVKSLLKNDQLLEVIETFELKISEDRLMSRCTKCNGMFIQKPLTTEEAMEAAKGFQVIPSCLFNKNLEFWQCMDCHQLYWEGTQYRNAVQKFMDICKLNE